MEPIDLTGGYTKEQLKGLTEEIARGLGLPASKELEAASEQMIKLLRMLLEIDLDLDVYVERNVREGRA